MLNHKWQKSSRSGAQGNCVELRRGAAAIQVRDSKLGDASPILDLDPATYASLIGGLKRR